MICFFDTNILIYAVDASDRARQDLAIACIARAVKDHVIVISTQVLQEFYNVTTRKLQPPMSPQDASSQVEALCGFEVLGATSQTILTATRLAQTHKLNWWDALILEAALRANAEVLYSEDGQHGRKFGPLTVINPFKEAQSSH